MLDLNIQSMTGVSLDLIVLALAALVVILIIILIVTNVRMGGLKKSLNRFMSGKDAESLEDTLSEALSKISELDKKNDANEARLQVVLENFNSTYQKVGVVKYDAFNEMGGKLSFSLALLNRKNDGFIINAMHSREGCYTYIKEVINGKSVILLAEEEQEALDMALNYGIPK